MKIEVAVTRWAAWAPGLSTAQDWLAWAREPSAPAGELQPPLTGMDSMMRRRLTRLGRMALQAGWDCQGHDVGVPMVFASRFGDVGRSLGLLDDLARDATVSPTAFSLSVHNAIAALYSMARADRSNAICVAAGRASAAAGLVEAAGLLADGAREVLIVCYDESLPADYAPFRDELACIWAWAWRVSPPTVGAPGLSLRVGALDSHEPPVSSLPASLEVMRFFLAGNGPLVQRIDGRRWEWRHHA